MLCCFPTPNKEKKKSATVRQIRNEENVQAIDMVALRHPTINNINIKMYEELQSFKEKYTQSSKETNQSSRETNERLDEMMKIHKEHLAQLEKEKEEEKKKRAEKDEEIKRLNDAMAGEEKAIGYNKINWYTLSSELQTIAGKLGNLTANIKPYFNPGNRLSKDDIVEFFKICWTEDLGYDDKRRAMTIKQVEKLFSEKTMTNIYEVVGVLVQKLLSDYFVHKIYLVPIHPGFDEQNKAYECIDDLLKEKNSATVKKIRVMMSNEISNRIDADKSWKDIRAKSKKGLTEEITNKLGEIYSVKDIKSKVKDVVFKAVGLSFPMHSQRNDIIIHNLETDGELYTNQVDPYNISYGDNPNKVFLGILPVIYADEAPLEEDHESETEDDNDDEEDDEEEEEEDDEYPVESDDDDEHPISKKETNKGKQRKKVEKIENKGSYQQKYFVIRGKAVGYELR